MAAQCWLVAYDVADQRRRTRLHKLLRSFGEAVQKSVFVCALDDRRKVRLETLLRRQSLEQGDRLDWFRIEAAQSLGASPALATALNPPAVVIVE